MCFQWGWFCCCERLTTEWEGVTSLAEFACLPAGTGARRSTFYTAPASVPTRDARRRNRFRYGCDPQDGRLYVRLDDSTRFLSHPVLPVCPPGICRGMLPLGPPSHRSPLTADKFNFPARGWISGPAVLDGSECINKPRCYCAGYDWTEPRSTGRHPQN